MKKAKKILTLVACAVLLVCISVGATLAYLTAATNTVQNTFTVGKVHFGDETDLNDGLDEAKVDEYGVPVAGADRVTENEYKLMPGHTYTKDPTATIGKGSEPAYVRMIVKITDMTDVKAVFGEDFMPEDFVNGTWNSNVWLSKAIAEGDDYAIYEFWYKDIVDARETEQKLPALFTEIAIPGTVTNEQVAKLADEYTTNDEGEQVLADEGMKIYVVAQAIQADGFDTADAAWAAAPAVTIDGTTYPQQP